MWRIASGMPIVRVSFNRYARLDGNGMHGYAYRWPFDYSAEVGDIVATDTGDEVTVIGFGTDYKGTLKTPSPRRFHIELSRSDVTPIAVINAIWTRRPSRACRTLRTAP